MISSKAVICLLLASVAFAEINTDFQHVISGEVELTDLHVQEMYSQFVSEYQHAPSKHLTSSLDRKNLFASKVKEVIEHNMNTNTYKKGINEFSDMTEDEFFEHFKFVKEPQDCSATNFNHVVEKKFALEELPNYWDWRNVGGVTPVKNQGKCGSCWTFSTVGSLESHYLIKYNQFRNLSEQQLVDCAGDYDNHGCEGGLPSHAFEYIYNTGGIAAESEYAYTAADNKCYYKQPMGSITVNGGSVNITSGDEKELKHAIFEHGPVSVCYQVKPGFRDYTTGVYEEAGCGTTTLDVNHAVLAVGYGNYEGTDYWIVKNSWGAAWGD
jgi:cathepsin H